MSHDNFALEISATELEDLANQLRNNASVDVTSFVSRAFNGETVLNVLVPLTPAAVVVARTWLTARAERGKSMSVTWQGRRLTGYTAREIAKIMEAIGDSDVTALDSEGADQARSDDEEGQ